MQMSDTKTKSSSVPSDVEINGSVTFGGDMIFAGRLKGGGIKGPTLVISQGAHVTGNIESDSCILVGTVEGDVMVTDRCELKSSAILIGDLTTSRLVMGEEATFVGKADIRPDKSKTV